MINKYKTVNHFGFLPINPDNFNSKGYGPGTNYPVGFSFIKLMKLYWTVRSFDCSFIGTENSDILNNILSNNPSSLLSILSILNTRNDNTFTLVGETTVSTSFQQKQRTGKRTLENDSQNIYTFEGIQNSQTQKSISFAYKSKLSFNSKAVTEGSLFSLGPVHKLTNGKSSVIIDLSYILYANSLYWPKINITVGPFSSLGGMDCINSVLFVNGKITMFYTGQNYNPLNYINGNIGIGTSECSRFLYDGFDKDRKNCKNIPKINY